MSGLDGVTLTIRELPDGAGYRIEGEGDRIEVLELGAAEPQHAFVQEISGPDEAARVAMHAARDLLAKLGHR